MKMPPGKGDQLPWLKCALLSVVLMLIAAAIVIPNLIEVRDEGNTEGPAIGSLKYIGMAQSRFRESDKEGDGNLDYGTLAELANTSPTGLIDSYLGSGTKTGYLFEATYGASTSEFLWFATARPMIPGETGDRYFCANHEGVTFYTTNGAFRLNSIECTVPKGARPVGK